jgi:hypothetical protein
MSEQDVYWAVECEERSRMIPLKKVREVEGMILELNWPDEFDVDCPYCQQPHSYIRQEIVRWSPLASDLPVALAKLKLRVAAGQEIPTGPETTR